MTKHRFRAHGMGQARSRPEEGGKDAATVAAVRVIARAHSIGGR